MFSKKPDLSAETGELVCKANDELTEENIRLKKEILDKEIQLDRLEERKKTEEQELKHMIRMKEERNELELEKAKAKIQADANKEVAKVKDQYRDKLEERLMAERDNIEKMCSQILDRLPNVTARLKGEI